MQDVELLERLLEAHRQIGMLRSEIGSLRVKLADTQSEVERARNESLDPARIRKLMEEAIKQDQGIVSLIKLYRAVMSMGLQDSKAAIDKSPLGQLIRSNMREHG